MVVLFIPSSAFFALSISSYLYVVGYGVMLLHIPKLVSPFGGKIQVEERRKDGGAHV